MMSELTSKWGRAWCGRAGKDSLWSMWFFSSLLSGVVGASGGLLRNLNAINHFLSLGHFSDSFLPQVNSSVYVD